MTKKINVYNKRKRAIKCITNKFDYLGDGELFYEDRLEVGKIYTMIDGKRKVFGHMVFIEEISSDCGFQSCLFEEMDEYDEWIVDVVFQMEGLFVFVWKRERFYS